MNEEKRVFRKKMTQEKRAKQIRTRVLTVAGVIAAAILLNLLYINRMEGKFYHFSVLNGYEVSGMDAAQVASLFARDSSSTFVNIREKGRTEMVVSLSNLGYTVDEASLTEKLEELIQNQREVFPWNIFGPEKYETEVPMTLDVGQLEETVSAENLLTPRVKTKNAELRQGEEDYYIQDEVYGTEMEDSDLQAVVRRAISGAVWDPSGEEINIDIPEEIYKKPEITKDSPQLSTLAELYNKYNKAKITYVFGSEKETIDWETIQDWVKIKDGHASLDEETMYHFLYDFATRHNTIYETRVFHTSIGTVVTPDVNDYGYQVDLDGEYFQLLEDLEKNTEIEREPVYSIRGYSRNGNDDLNGYYIEVNLTMQHLWMYYEGGLVLETDVVTGTPGGTRETVEGAYAIPYKASPFNLVGQGGGGSTSWDVEVQYWMPFCDGQGLHDAKWRSSFGGAIYKTYGSHGCVNLPEYAAAIIYSYVGTNMPIILYK